MERLFKFQGTEIHYEILVSRSDARMVKLHQELVCSDDVLYLKIRKFLEHLILAQVDFRFNVVLDSDLPF